MFTYGNKVAKGIGHYICFKTSTVFTDGKKFYFQVSANIGDGGNMGFGILSGEVTTYNVGGHEKGWDYNCNPWGTPKCTYHNNQQSSGYGPERTKGKYKFGIFCDFTNGKGEVSFIVNGKNWGVAYDNVKPPVSPAFYICSQRDSFKIDDAFELPICEVEIAITKNPKPKEPIVVKEKQREMEMLPSSVAVPIRGFSSWRGILVPQNVVFEVNERYSQLKQAFSNGNKVARGVDSATVCFKTSAVFTAGKKFYFQVSANVGSGSFMGFGILSGAVTTYNVGDHEKGWEYHCYQGNPPKRINHNNQQLSGYGPERTLGKHTYGIFCDFTNGKGEVSFIVDGKNWGVAYRNVQPPVSPAFYILDKRDSFEIEDTFEFPNCEFERAVKGLKASNLTKNPKSKESIAIVVKEKEREMEMLPSSVAVPRGFTSQRGILVPQNVVFEMNTRYRSVLKKIFSNGNKVAKGIEAWVVCFKTSAVFTSGKKFYFQVSANVRTGNCMGFGILSGEVTTNNVGYHAKGWVYNCEPGEYPPKVTFHNKKESRGYGPKRTLGKHSFGIFCDFTNGKGEVSFIVDGKNWGVAYKNVKPPVSPAFYIKWNEDSFTIDDGFEVPDCAFDSEI